MDPYYQQDGITIFCGDCREILPTLPKVDLVLTDPPYGIEDKPNTINDPRRRGTNTWHPPSDWDKQFPSEHAGLICDYSEIVAWFGHWRKRHEAEQAMRWPIRCEIIWAKDMHTGPPCPAAMQDERIWVFSKSGLKPNGFETTVWHMPVIPTWEHKLHKNEKPEALMRRCVRWLPGETILDPFMGSGTTLLAAKLEGRKAIGIEISEEFCEKAANRLRQKFLF